MVRNAQEDSEKPTAGIHFAGVCCSAPRSTDDPTLRKALRLSPVPRVRLDRTTHKLDILSRDKTF